jgi:hypothetical protein
VCAGGAGRGSRQTQTPSPRASAPNWNCASWPAPWCWSTTRPRTARRYAPNSYTAARQRTYVIVVVSRAASRQLVVPHHWGTRLGVWCKWSGLSTAGGTPTAGVPGWACGVSGAASRQLVVSHRWGTRLGVWCKWSRLSTAGGTPPLGYPAGRVATPASPDRPPREGHKRTPLNTEITTLVSSS